MPYSGEHVANLKETTPDIIGIQRTRGSANIPVQGIDVPESISIMWHKEIVNGKEASVPYSIRFPEKRWTAIASQEWLDNNKIKHLGLEISTSKQKDRPPCYSYYINKAKSQLNIIMHDEIGLWGTQSKDFYQLLAENKDVKIISVDINSPGGSVFHGFSIYEALKSHKAEVRVKVSGIAASIASVIAMAGDTIEMPETSMMMIHKPFAGVVVGADADKLRNQATALDKMENSIVLAYKSRMSKTEKEIKNMLKETTWLSALEAQGLGLADTVTEEEDVLNYFDFSDYNYGEVPETVLSKYGIDRNDKITAQGIDKMEFSRIIDYVKKLTNFKKEPENMTEAEFNTRIEVLEKEKAQLNATNTTLVAENETLTKTVKSQTEVMQASVTDTRKNGFKSFCENLVKEGKILPASIDFHVNNMELNFQADAQSTDKTQPATEAYRQYLGEQAPIIDVGTDHFANKGDAAPPDSGNEMDAINKKANEILVGQQAAGKALTFRQAFDMAQTPNA